MSTYGRQASSDPDFGTIPDDELRLCVFNASTKNGWVTDLGFHGGVPFGAGGSRTVKVAMYRTDAAKNPTDRLGYSEDINVATEMSFGGDGAAYEGDVVESTQEFSPDDDAIAIWAGERYALGLLVTNGSLNHGMIAISRGITPSPDNTLFYKKSGQSVPPHPIGSYTTQNNGHMTVWATFTENRAPTAGASAPSGSVSSMAATPLAGTFMDADRTAGFGDRIERYQFWIRRKSDGVTLWAPAAVDASPAQQSSSTFTQSYGGPTPTAGVTYEVLCKVWDFHGTSSAWSTPIEFTYSSNAIVTLDGSPTGKIADASPDTWQFRYHHPAGTSSNAVQVRIFKAGSASHDYESPIITKSVASSALPGTLSSVTWAQVASPTDLARGQNLEYSFRARATTNVWGEWSARRAFNINALPNAPISMSPSGNVPVTSFPLITYVLTDPDDTTVTGLTSTIEFTRPDLTTVTVSASYDAVAGRFFFQTTGTQLNQFGTYSYRAKGNDGDSDGPWSNPQLFQYVQGISVTITSPTEGQVLITTSPNVTYTVGGSGTQVSRQATIVDTETDEVVWADPFPVVTASLTFQVPSGYLDPDPAKVYAVQVAVTNSLSQTGSSIPRTFTINIPDPTPIQSFQASPLYGHYDVEPTMVLLTWETTDYPPGTFKEYVITRRPKTGNIEGEGFIILARIKSASVDRWVDDKARSGVEYRYRINQTIRTSTGDEQDSISVYADIAIGLTTTVFSSVQDPEEDRAVALYYSQRSVDHISEQENILPWGAEKPTVVRSATHHHLYRMTVRLVDDHHHTARSYAEGFRKLKHSHADAAGAIICVRDPKSRKYFGVVVRMVETDTRGGIIDIEIELQEVNFIEGVPQA